MAHTSQRLKTIRRAAWIIACTVVAVVLLVVFGPALWAEDSATTPTIPPSKTPYDLGIEANDEGACDTCAEKCRSCATLHVCAEARQCLEWGHTELDPDGDGVPCEMLCPGG